MSSHAPPPTPLPIEGRVRRWRVPSGVALGKLGAPSPLGVRETAPLAPAPLEPGDAVLALPPSAVDANAPWALAESLPDPAATAGALVVLLPSPLRTGLLAKLSLRRVESIPRAVRGAALLLRGYRAIGGGVDPHSGLDLVWGEP